ncbi:MAG TPA: hydroxyacid dehydrogenase, partial [Clostridiales bacterium]|nr:hydroxyacid dehydrogenase [Clostridiales bacterium]
IITPHIAWATVEARKRVTEEVYKNILAFLNGEERNIVRS